MGELVVETSAAEELVDITSRIAGLISIRKGIVLVYVPHTTAALFINENADEGIREDIVRSLSTLVPKRAGWKHDAVDGNAHAHIKSALLGPSQMIPVIDGKLALGTWQGVFLAEFDGPRSRRVLVEEMGK